MVIIEILNLRIKLNHRICQDDAFRRSCSVNISLSENVFQQSFPVQKHALVEFPCANAWNAKFLCLTLSDSVRRYWHAYKKSYNLQLSFYKFVMNFKFNLALNRWSLLISP